MPNRSCHVGQTITEYVLIGSLVLLIAIPAVALLGTNLKTDFGNMLGSGWAESKNTQLTATAGTQGAGSSPSSGPASSAYAPSVQEASTKPVDGTVQTAGVNGNQELISEQADAVERIAEQLAKDPNADPKLVDLVTQLALAGHTLGDNLAQSAASVKNPAVFFPAYEAFWKSALPYNDLKSQLDSYLAQNPSALTPQMQAIIQDAVSATNAKVDTLVSSDGPNYNGWDAPSLTSDASGGGAINTDANTTCQNGGDTSVCVK